MPQLPNNVIFVDPKFDPNKCPLIFKILENAMKVAKEAGSNGCVSGTYAMKNNGENKSLYYFELEYDPTSGGRFWIGFSKLLTNLNCSNGLKGIFINCSSGKLYNKGNLKNYLSKITTKTKMGFLLDMYKGSLKLYVNDQD